MRYRPASIQNCNEKCETHVPFKNSRREMIPTSTDVTLEVKDAAPANIEAIVVFSTDAGPKVDRGNLDDASRAALKRLAAGGALRGKTKEVVFDILEVSPGKFRRIFSIGLGESEKVTTETIRQSAAHAARALRKHRIARAAFVAPVVSHVAISDAVEAVIIGGVLAAFDYEEYKGTGQKKEEDAAPKKLAWAMIAPKAQHSEVSAAVERGKAIADGQNFARTIASRPGNNINPPTLANVALEMAKEAGLKCTVLDEKQMLNLGMGGILAVGAGSIATPPRMIALEYNGTAAKKSASTPKAAKHSRAQSKSADTENSKPLLVVGKSITFDTGGISIKPADKMGNMIYDKCGGMAVLGLMYALAKLKTPIHVVGVLSSAENAVSSQAYRPGDILRMYNGVTVDVTNTDAEGRLVLGDALAWGIETYEPAAVVDLATLTGGVVTALGRDIAGVMSNNDALVS